MFLNFLIVNYNLNKTQGNNITITKIGDYNFTFFELFTLFKITTIDPHNVIRQMVI